MSAGEPESPTRRFPLRDVGAALCLALAAWAVPWLGARWSRPLFLNLGPNDVDYVRGFREDWERDGKTRFHWTSPAASIRLPVQVSGSGVRLRMRARRHFLEPAHVRLAIEGRTVARFDLQADPHVAYPILEFPLPELDGRLPFVLAIEAPSENPRPLGIAVDWIELRRGSQGATVFPDSGLPARAGLLVLIAFGAVRLAGGRRALASLHAGTMVAALAVGCYWDLVAAERIVREGTPIYAAVAGLALIAVRWPRLRTTLGIDSGGVAGGLVALTLVALAVRLTLLLHPQFYYPDVKVHGLFAWQLARRGLGAFLADFTANQYRYSLGLQFENGHWYAFPYPPAFYLMSWPLVSLGGYHHQVAVSCLAAAVNSLEVLLVFGLARRLRGTTAVAIGSAATLPLLPLFLRRLTLAYFPAIVGHAVDLVLLFVLLGRLEVLQKARTILVVAGLLALALLTYTQSLLNFALILPLFLATQAVFDRSPGARRRQIGLVAAGLLGAVLSLVVFYGRYVPVFLDMRRGVPMAEEQILLDKLKAERSAADEDAAPEDPDPYTGADLDLWRGLRKAAWRMWVFYGPFAPLAVAGIVLLLRRLEGAPARLGLTWALTYVVLNLASGGLPGPNLVRYNKDLEVVAPLVSVGLGSLAVWLGERWRAAGLLVAGGYLVFGVLRAFDYLVGTFVAEGR